MVWVKICGTTNVDDALLAVALDADALGFIFAPSKRQIAPRRAQDIVARVPREIHTVGVFRNEARERVVDIVHNVGLSTAQLHGNESPADVEWISERIPNVIKAVAAGTDQARRADEFATSILLVDALTPGGGGGGKTFDWSLMSEIPSGKHILLAGGLSPDNVRSAIDVVSPWGVDVASGVEKEPGRKDPAALRKFIQNAKGISSPRPEPVEQPEVD